jgi:hypothetical protein
MAHAHHFQVCMFHALGAYIVTAGSRIQRRCLDEPIWLFPEYVDLSDGGVAAKVSNILKGLSDDIKGLDKDHASHALRIGPTDDLAMECLVDLVSRIILKGDWQWEGECMIFNYLTTRLHVTRAGTRLFVEHAGIWFLFMACHSTAACLAFL